jgi:putative CocE/NonD family hydrolase
VRIFVTGTDQWRDLPAWPPVATARTWYLQPDGQLGADLPGDSQPDEYTYDPANPTPNLAGPVGAQGAARVDNRMLEARPDVLTFTGTTLAAELEVIGVPAVELHVASDREHTDVFARLCEVEPTGRSVNICDGLLRTSPGGPAAAADGSRRVTFELWPVAHRFGAGSRIRLQVSSGAHPRYARNTGTGESLATTTRLLPAHQRVYHDPAHPSAVILPVTS